MRKLILPFLVLLVALPALVTAQSPSDFAGDTAQVLRWHKGYKYPQSGWTVVHLEGEPYERGIQHGRLLASEIAAHLRSFAQIINYKAPAESWKTVRTFSNALFLRKFDKEYLEEMKGIADGASAAGARFDGRPIDLVDIACLNCWAEIDSLSQAAAATPTGLETQLFPSAQPDAPPVPRGEHCSAFAATGPATVDGKIVFGHITMFDLYPSNFYNVWLDIQPAKGHRFVMCAYPGAIQSGMDYYINDAGLLISETTITQTKFDVNGQTLASRIRKAIQYAETIDQAVAILQKENNGLYTNEWLLADINTNEIAMFELGTHKYKLWRSSKNEWFGDTPGFYWGCNNVKDVDVRLETIPSAKANPASLIFRPSSRDIAWQQFYQKHKGKIGLEFAKETLTSPKLALPSSLDAKYTNSAMAKNLQSWAMYGPPTGNTWNPRKDEKDKYPEIKPLVANPWTILGTIAPPKDAGREAPLIAAAEPAPKAKGKKAGGSSSKAQPVWRGTLLPQTDGDLWLAIGFAEYERLVATERAGLAKGETPEAVRATLDKSVDNSRKAVANNKLVVALAELKANSVGDDWYRLASNKGVVLLHELRSQVGPALFDKTMDEFGMKFGGQRVTSKQFQTHFEQAAGRQLDGFFGPWLRDKELPGAKAETK